MHFDDIKKEYKFFEESICQAHSCLFELILALKKFLYDYIKIKNYNRELAEKIEIDLVYLEHFYNNVDDILEYIDKLEIKHLLLPPINSKIENQDYKIYIENTNDNTFVDIDCLINWKYKS